MHTKNTKSNLPVVLKMITNSDRSPGILTLVIIFETLCEAKVSADEQ